LAPLGLKGLIITFPTFFRKVAGCDNFFIIWCLWVSRAWATKPPAAAALLRLQADRPTRCLSSGFDTYHIATRSNWSIFARAAPPYLHLIWRRVHGGGHYRSLHVPWRRHGHSVTLWQFLWLWIITVRARHIST